MKIIGTFGGVVIASIAMLQPVQAGHRGNGRSFSPGFQSSGGVRQFSAPARNFSSGGARFHNSSRFSSGGSFRNRSFSGSGPRFGAFQRNDFNTQAMDGRGTFRNRSLGWNGQRLAPDRFSGRSRWDGQRSGTNRSSGFRNRGFNNNSRDGIVGRRGGNWNRHWDKRRDHYWRGHRCRWINNSWVIFATGFYPYGYGYYPYGAYYPYSDYSYYDDSYYADDSAPNEYAKASESEYEDAAADSSISAVQSALSREGYYSGAVDGSFGVETRNALRRYQRDRGLKVTGQIDRATTNALGLR